MLGQVGGGMRARWTRGRALPGVSALKGEALGGRFLRGTEPGKEGGEVCARPLLPEDPVFESGVRVGWWRGGGARGRLSAFRPEEERLDPKKVTQAPLGTLGTLGLRAALDPYASPGFQGTRVLAGRGCWARGLGPPGFRASLGSGKNRHVVGSVLPPPTPPLGPHLFSIKFKLGLLGVAAHSLPPPIPLLYSAPSRFFTLPLSLSHHLVSTLPCSPSLLAGASESGCAHLCDPNISTISSARRQPAPGSVPAPPPAGHCAPLNHTARAPENAQDTVVK